MFDAGQHCRIGRVRLKSGGEFHVLARPTASETGECLARDAREIAELFGSEINGYVVIGWNATGAYRHGSYTPRPGVIGMALLPSWLAEIVRREIVTADDVRSIIDTEYVTPNNKGL